jgi:hypothetical protein
MRTTVIFILLLVTLTLIPAPARAGVGAGQFDRILFLPDVSGSLDESEYAHALDLIAGDLPWIARAVGAASIDVVPWASSASCWRSPTLTITLPTPQTVDAVVPKRADADILYRSGWESKQAGAVEETRRHQAAADSLYFRDCAKELNSLRRLVASLTDQHDPCSALSDILGRCSGSSKRVLALLITDAVEVCAAATVPTSLPEGAWTIAVLVPNEDDQGDVGRALGERRRRLEARAPWIRVVHSFELTQGPEAWLADRLPPRPEAPDNPTGRR